MAADSEESARKVPLIAAVPKMFFPFLVILPGLIAVSLTSQTGPGQSVSDHVKSPSQIAGQRPVNGTLGAHLPAAGQPVNSTPLDDSHPHGIIPAKTDPINGRPVLDANGHPVYDYNLAIPLMLIHFFPTGILGLGLTALLASFMSGMAGNVTAFNTVWTYDIYQAYINKHATDAHYLWMGRMATVCGIILSIAAAYTVTSFNNIMDALQLVFAFVNAPLFATFLLGMFWKRTTGHGAFAGLIAGTEGALLHHGLTLPSGDPTGIHGGWITVLHTYPSEMSQNFWTGIFAFAINLVVAICGSLATRTRPDSELVGLVYSLTAKPKEAHLKWYQKPAILAIGVTAILVVLNLTFA